MGMAMVPLMATAMAMDTVMDTAIMKMRTSLKRRGGKDFCHKCCVVMNAFDWQNQMAVDALSKAPQFLP